MTTANRGLWLVSKRFDLLAFGLPAAIALALVPLGPWLAPTGETPIPMWVIAVLLVDVAHVWSTIYRTYLDGYELRRRPLLYGGVPVAVYGVGVMLAAWSWATFWTALAYMAVFHFVRQQYGWVSLYNRRDPGAGLLERRIDAVAVYAATVFPLLWWHAHLPRRFHWFLPGDFAEGWVAGSVVDALWPVYVGILVAFVGMQMRRGLRDGVRWGKVTVVVTTALCWGIGIIATDSDWAFTVTNVLIHGVPYMAIIWAYGEREAPRYPEGAWQRRLFGRAGGAVVFIGLVASLAYVEEWGWDRLIWHGGTGLFWGPTLELGDAVALVVPLLALPQATHYVLDAVIWRRAFLSQRAEALAAYRNVTPGSE